MPESKSTAYCHRRQVQETGPQVASTRSQARGAGLEIRQIDIAVGDNLGIIGKFTGNLLDFFLSGLRVPLSSLVSHRVCDSLQAASVVTEFGSVTGTP